MTLEQNITRTHHHYHHHHPTLDSDDLEEEEEEGEEESFRPCPRLGVEEKTGWSLVWRVLTLLLCLPICYPCYLTRKAR